MLNQSDKGRRNSLPDSHNSTGVKGFLGRRLSLDFLYRPNSVKWILNFVISAIIAGFVMFPGSLKIPMKTYEVGGIAREDIIASRDLTIVDPDATEASRKLAEDQVFTVFDYDPRLKADIEKKVIESFNAFRSFYQEEWDWGDREKQRIEELKEDNPRDRSKAVPFPAMSEIDLAGEEDLKSQFGVVLTDREFRFLKKDRYSSRSEKKILELIGKVMDNGIVSSMDVLMGQRDKGITVRDISAQSNDNAEQILKDLSNFADIQEARELIKKNSRSLYKEFGRGLSRIIVDISAELIQENYTLNRNEAQLRRQLARDAQETRYKTVKAGQLIVSKGEVIDEDIKLKLDENAKASQGANTLLIYVGMILLIALFGATSFSFAERNIRKFQLDVKETATFGALLVILLFIMKLLMITFTVRGFGPVPAEGLRIEYLVPLAAAGMLARLLINSEVAIIYSILTATMAGLMAEDAIFVFIYMFIGNIMGATEVGQCRQRSRLLKAGLLVGVTNMVVIFVFSMKDGSFAGLGDTVGNMALGLTGGLIAGFLVLGLMPILEAILGLATDIKLIELGSQEHPLLKELMLKAPGTYQHSNQIGLLAEAAAEEIQANPILARVAAYYHDIGKISRPHYFTENQRDGVNPHDSLSPRMSALILIDHVKDGMKLAKSYNIPTAIADAIPQHHGTRLIKYFYSKAKENEDPDVEQIDEKDYHHIGPKPQTRETGIIMLSDSVEATVKSLKDPTPNKIEATVKKTIENIFNEGQLDECELTLKDLNRIGKAFTRVLTSFYHHRPEYPTIPGESEKKGDKLKLVQ